MEELGVVCGFIWRKWSNAKENLASFCVFSLRENKRHSTCKCSRDCSNCFVVVFFSVYFLSALQSDDNSNRVYVLGHKHVLGPSQAHFE